METSPAKETPSVSNQPASRSSRIGGRPSRSTVDTPQPDSSTQSDENERPRLRTGQSAAPSSDQPAISSEEKNESPQPTLRERLQNRTVNPPLKGRIPSSNIIQRGNSRLTPASSGKQQAPESETSAKPGQSETGKQTTPLTIEKKPGTGQPAATEGGKSSSEEGSVKNLRILLNQRRNQIGDRAAKKSPGTAAEVKPNSTAMPTPGAANQSTPAETRNLKDMLRNRKTESATGQPSIPATPTGGPRKAGPLAPGSLTDQARATPTPAADRTLKTPANAQPDAMVQRIRDMKLPGMDRPLPSADQLGKISSKIPQQRLENFAIRQRAEAALIGADMKPDIAKDLGIREKLLSKNDAGTLLGKVEPRPRPDLTKNDLASFRVGRLPQHIERPHGNFGRVTRAADLSLAFNYVAPPPPPRHGYGVDLGGFSWNYWDGRSYYDHSYAMNIFVNIGKTRYDGYDGIMWGGRYYCYGWGWVDGCIDYGDCRVWVPGFWAPYNVTVCDPTYRVWVPPVCEWMLIDDRWEYVQVDGGYFETVNNPECRLVTRWAWVPGHYEYYYC